MPLPSFPQQPEPGILIHEAENLARTLGHIYVNTSAKDNHGVNELFQRVAERVLRFRKQNEMGVAQVPIPVTPGAIATSLRTPVSNNSHSSNKLISSAASSGAKTGSGGPVGGYRDRHDFDYAINENGSSYHSSSQTSDMRANDKNAPSHPSDYDAYRFDTISGDEDDTYDQEFQSIPG